MNYLSRNHLEYAKLEATSCCDFRDVNNIISITHVTIKMKDENTSPILEFLQVKQA